MEIGKKKDKNQGQGEWILTYSDMMTLLLTFFVLLYSYSRVVVTFDGTKTAGISDEEIFNRIRGLVESWELSAARGSAVVRYLVNSCGLAPEQLEAVGCGEFKIVVKRKAEQ